MTNNWIVVKLSLYYETTRIPDPLLYGDYFAWLVNGSRSPVAAHPEARFLTSLQVTQPHCFTSIKCQHSYCIYVCQDFEVLLMFKFMALSVDCSPSPQSHRRSTSIYRLDELLALQGLLSGRLTAISLGALHVASVVEWWGWTLYFRFYYYFCTLPDMFLLVSSYSWKTQCAV